jgi:hypothetical protein
MSTVQREESKVSRNSSRRPFKKGGFIITVAPPAPNRYVIDTDRRLLRNKLHSWLEVAISSELSAVARPRVCDNDEQNPVPELRRDFTAVPTLRRCLRHVALMLIIVINQIMQNFETRPVRPLFTLVPFF